MKIDGYSSDYKELKDKKEGRDCRGAQARGGDPLSSLAPLRGSPRACPVKNLFRGGFIFYLIMALY